MGRLKKVLPADQIMLAGMEEQVVCYKHQEVNDEPCDGLQ